MRQFHGLWVACLLYFMASIWTKVESRGSSCSKVLGVGTPSKPEFPTQGSAPQTCLSSKTCCTNQMESTLRRKAVTKMKSMVSRKLDGRIQSTRSLREDIKGYFQSVVQDGYQRGLLFLGKSHVNLSRPGSPLLGTFFTKIEQSIEDENVNITDVVLDFFRHSFPLLYQYTSGSSRQLSKAYEKCLKDRMVDIRPFEGDPTRIANNLISVLKPVQVFLESLAFASKIIDGSKRLSFTTGCDPVLLQMTFCSLCHGYLDTLKPCNGYCMDVLEKCLSPTIELQKHWKVYFVALDNLASSLAGSTNAETVISTVYRDLSTAVTQVIARVTEVKLEAYRFCGQPQFMTRSSSPAGGTPALKPTSLSSHLRTTISAKMESAKSKMTLLNTLFGELPNAICVTDGVAAKIDRKDVASANCWNGTAKARYTGPLDAPSSSFQILSSDMTSITSLVSGMKETIKMMKRHTNNDNGGDGSGSGDSNVLAGSGCNSDDDDCGSGSGDNGNTVDRMDGKIDDNDIYIADSTPNPKGDPNLSQDGGAVDANKSGRGGASSHGTLGTLGTGLLSLLAISAILLSRI